MSEKTDWYSPEINPVRKGWYETQSANIISDSQALKAIASREKLGYPFYMRYWDGKSWCMSLGCVSAFQRRWWRGLTEPSA